MNDYERKKQNALMGIGYIEAHVEKAIFDKKEDYEVMLRYLAAIKEFLFMEDVYYIPNETDKLKDFLTKGYVGYI